MALSESGRLRFPACAGGGWWVWGGMFNGAGSKEAREGGRQKRQQQTRSEQQALCQGKQRQESLSLGVLKRLITYEFYHLERSIKPTSAQTHPDAYCSAPALIRAQRGSCAASPNISQVKTKTGLICLADASLETSTDLLRLNRAPVSALNQGLPRQAAMILGGITLSGGGGGCLPFSPAHVVGAVFPLYPQMTL